MKLPPSPSRVVPWGSFIHTLTETTYNGCIAVFNNEVRIQGGHLISAIRNDSVCTITVKPCLEEKDEKWRIELPEGRTLCQPDSGDEIEIRDDGIIIVRVRMNGDLYLIPPKHPVAEEIRKISDDTPLHHPFAVA